MRRFSNASTGRKNCQSAPAVIFCAQHYTDSIRWTGNILQMRSGVALSFFPGVLVYAAIVLSCTLELHPELVTLVMLQGVRTTFCRHWPSILRRGLHAANRTHVQIFRSGAVTTCDHEHARVNAWERKERRRCWHHSSQQCHAASLPLNSS